MWRRKTKKRKKKEKKKEEEKRFLGKRREAETSPMFRMAVETEVARVVVYITLRNFLRLSYSGILLSFFERQKFPDLHGCFVRVTFFFFFSFTFYHCIKLQIVFAHYLRLQRRMSFPQYRLFAVLVIFQNIAKVLMEKYQCNKFIVQITSAL